MVVVVFINGATLGEAVIFDDKGRSGNVPFNVTLGVKVGLDCMWFNVTFWSVIGLDVALLFAMLVMLCTSAWTDTIFVVDDAEVCVGVTDEVEAYEYVGDCEYGFEDDSVDAEGTLALGIDDVADESDGMIDDSDGDTSSGAYGSVAVADDAVGVSDESVYDGVTDGTELMYEMLV